MKTERTCRVCGCTDSNACEGGCCWVEEDLCSQCFFFPYMYKPIFAKFLLKEINKFTKKINETKSKKFQTFFKGIQLELTLISKKMKKGDFDI